MTILRNMADWDSDNTSHGDHLVLSGGKSGHYAILSSNESEPEVMSIGQITSWSHWQTNIEVFQALNTFGTDLTTLYGLIDNIVREFEQYPNLGNGAGDAIQGAYPIRAGEPVEATMKMAGTSRGFYKMDVVIAWSEERTIALAGTP